jgi:competence protein ComEA
VRARLDELLAFVGSPRRALTGAAAALAGMLAVAWLLRSPPPPVETALPMVTVASGVSVEPSGRVVVYVSGEVVSPGVYELDAGARVTDAVIAAGGTTSRADLEAVNMAEPLVEAAHVSIPARGAQRRGGSPGRPRPGVNPPAGTTAGGKVSLSRATVAELVGLPGVGPATAAAIVAHRDRHGAFGSVDDLLAVRGIGPAKLEGLRDLVVP